MGFQVRLNTPKLSTFADRWPTWPQPLQWGGSIPGGGFPSWLTPLPYPTPPSPMPPQGPLTSPSPRWPAESCPAAPPSSPQPAGQ